MLLARRSASAPRARSGAVTRPAGRLSMRRKQRSIMRRTLPACGPGPRMWRRSLRRERSRQWSPLRRKQRSSKRFLRLTKRRCGRCATTGMRFTSFHGRKSISPCSKRSGRSTAIGVTAGSRPSTSVRSTRCWRRTLRRRPRGKQYHRGPLRQNGHVSPIRPHRRNRKLRGRHSLLALQPGRCRSSRRLPNASRQARPSGALTMLP